MSAAHPKAAIEERAREICIARNVDPDAYIIGDPAGSRAWHYLREVATIDLDRAARTVAPQMELPL